MAEQVPFKHVVGGSNPSGLTRRLASLRVSIVPNKVKVVHTNPSGLTRPLTSYFLRFILKNLNRPEKNSTGAKVLSFINK